MELAEQYGRPTPEGIEVKLHLSQRDLAGMIACSREIVNKQLGYFRRKGLIQLPRGTCHPTTGGAGASRLLAATALTDPRGKFSASKRKDMRAHTPPSAPDDVAYCTLRLHTTHSLLHPGAAGRTQGSPTAFRRCAIGAAAGEETQTCGEFGLSTG